jgi:alkaline phosphatase D
MTKLTRRSALGLGGAVFGLAACGDKNGSRDKRPPFNGEVSFNHGVASGDPLSDRVILWTRVTPKGGANGPVPMSWEIFGDREMNAAVDSGITAAEPGRDHTVKVDAEGLSSGTDFFYRFTAHTNSGDITSPIGRARTLNASGDAPVKLAVVSCTNWPYGFFNAYSALAHTSDLDAIIHLGDYIYESGADG